MIAAHNASALYSLRAVCAARRIEKQPARCLRPLNQVNTDSPCPPPLPSQVWHCHPTEKVVYNALAEFSYGTHSPIMPKVIADFTGLSHTTVTKYLKILKRRRLVKQYDGQYRGWKVTTKGRAA